MEDSNLIFSAKFSAPSKIILSGEHSVVYGHPAIAFAVGSYRDQGDDEHSQAEKIYRTELTIKVWNRTNETDSLLKFTSELFSTEFSDFNDIFNYDGKEELAVNLAKIFTNSAERAINDHKNHDSSFKSIADKYCFAIHVHFGTPVGAGLGSSATFNVLVCGSVFTIFNSLLSESVTSYISTLMIDSAYLSVVNELAYYGEKLIHGNPSGIDNFITTMGGMVRYSKSSDGTISTKTELNIPKEFS